MKKSVFLITALLLVSLLLAACMSAGSGNTQTTTTAPGTTTTAPVPTTTEPVPTTEMQDPELEAFNALLGSDAADSERNGFYFATSQVYSSFERLDLAYYFGPGYPGEPGISEAEWDELEEISPFSPKDYICKRLPKDKVEAELLAVFGVSLADLPEWAVRSLYYLESTNCYYCFERRDATYSGFAYALAVEHNDDGTVSVIYTDGNVTDGEEDQFRITLARDGDSYRVLSNWRVTPQDVAELEAFNEFFDNGLPGRNPYFWATGYEYTSPLDVKLVNFFDNGFPGEHEKTDAEYEGLKELVNHIEWLENAEFNRLPKDKMEADLQAVYGISLADLPDSAYEGLYYLESTDCYYSLQTGPFSDHGGQFLAIEHNDDGTVSLTYENSNDKFIITLKPNGDSYQVLSNVKATE